MFHGKQYFPQWFSSSFNVYTDSTKFTLGWGRSLLKQFLCFVIFNFLSHYFFVVIPKKLLNKTGLLVMWQAMVVMLSHCDVVYIVMWWIVTSQPLDSHLEVPLIARFMGPIQGQSGANRTQVYPMLAPGTLLFGTASHRSDHPLDDWYCSYLSYRW